MEQVIALMARRRDAAIKTILRTKELEADPCLSPEVRSLLRKVVLDNINELHEAWVDVLTRYENSGVQVNQLWLEKKFEALHEAIQNGR